MNGNGGAVRNQYTELLPLSTVLIPLRFRGSGLAVSLVVEIPEGQRQLQKVAFITNTVVEPLIMTCTHLHTHARTRACATGLSLKSH